MTHHHPDEYGRRPPHKFGIVDMNDRPPLPSFIAREQALRRVEAELAPMVEQLNKEAPVEDEPFNALKAVKELMAALPTLKSIEVADGIIAAGKFQDKAPTAVELAVAMATWGSEK